MPSVAAARIPTKPVFESWLGAIEDIRPARRPRKTARI